MYILFSHCYNTLIIDLGLYHQTTAKKRLFIQTVLVKTMFRCFDAKSKETLELTSPLTFQGYFVLDLKYRFGAFCKRIFASLR